MIITSPSFDDGNTIPKKFTCDGGDINPELLIQNVPAEARSLALIMHDPDAPTAGGFTHWTVWNIDPATTLIKDESIPSGSVEGSNDAGQSDISVRARRPERRITTTSSSMRSTRSSISPRPRQRRRSGRRSKNMLSQMRNLLGFTDDETKTKEP